MADPYRRKAELPVKATATGTNGGATATISGVANKSIVVEQISISSDLAALITIESPNDTILWQMRFAGSFAATITFPPGMLFGPAGQDANVTLSASTSHSEANIMGYLVDAGNPSLAA